MYKTIDHYELEPDQIIFKHSLTCGTSAYAKQFIDELSQTEDVIFLVVQKERELSREIAEKLGIKHESPQLIIVRRGRVAAVFNHWHITKDAVDAVLVAEHSH